MKLDRNQTIIISVMIIVALILIIFFTVWNAKEATTITTQGMAEMKVMPDSVVVYLNIQGIDKSADAAKNKVSGITERVYSSLENLVDKEDIETENFNIYPNYDWTSGGQDITGYTATQSIKITTDNFDIIGKIVDKTVDAGALINYINFELSQEKENELKAQLLSEASKDARNKADAIAGGLEKRVTKIKNIQTDAYNYYPYPLYARAEAGSVADAKEAVVNINPKKLDLSASVSVTFEIK